MTQTILIGIDWGSSNVRGFRYGPSGNVLETRRLGAGLKSIHAGGWADAYETHFGDWMTESPQVPVLLSGMVGSRQGWCEAPYVSCPVRIEDVSDHLHQIPETSKWIVPGLSSVDADGVPDVMRGEETQLAGLEGPMLGSTMICLPGTHTKWAQVENGRIDSFRTFMTGEVFDVLMNHSLIGRMAASGEFDDEAFKQGLQRSRDSSQLLHDLFSVRTLRLFDRMPDTAVAAYLSGLLISHELGGVIDSISEGATVTIVGSSQLSQHYGSALRYWSRDVRFVEGEAAAAGGLWRIAKQAKLIAAET